MVGFGEPNPPAADGIKGDYGRVTAVSREDWSATSSAMPMSESIKPTPGAVRSCGLTLRPQP